MADLTADVQAILLEPEERAEGHLKVRGAARYAADAAMPGMLWSATLYSPLPHARIVSVDASAARRLPGVHAVLTGAELGSTLWGRRIRDWPLLAVDRVRFVGDRLAIVAAETHALAEAAVRAIEVEYAELPAVFDVLEALRDDAPILHPEGDAYALFGPGSRAPRSHPNVQGTQVVHKDDAEIDLVFAQAERVFEHTFTTPREHQGFIEPPASLLWIDEHDVVHVVCTNKMPFGLRDQLVTVAGLGELHVDVDANYVGGDFGGKGQVYNELLSYFLAQATGRPIKSVLSYTESLTTHNSRHSAHLQLRSAVERRDASSPLTMELSSTVVRLVPRPRSGGGLARAESSRAWPHIEFRMCAWRRGLSIHQLGAGRDHASTRELLGYGRRKATSTSPRTHWEWTRSSSASTTSCAPAIST